MATISLSPALATHKTENVFLITIDGLRWQEVLKGAEESLMTSAYGVKDTNQHRSLFLPEAVEEFGAHNF